MINRKNDIWVFMEAKEDGQLKSVGLELLTPGRRLADQQNGQLVAVLIGAGLEQALEEVSMYGPDQMIVLEDEIYREYSTDVYTTALCWLIQKYEPSGILVGATVNARDIIPRIACRLKTGLTADCTEVDFDSETGNILWTRPTFGGNLMACIMCPDHRPQMGTIRQGIYKKQKSGSRCTSIIRETFHIAVDAVRTKVYETIRETGNESINLEEAEIIVAGGKGVGGTEGFRLLEELAEMLGASIAATRGAVESGWISHPYQVGQTGKTVNPKLYIACGISGAVQHMVGMSGAEVVIAINQDKNAPIFKVADYGFVGDLKEIVPALMELISKM